MIDIANVKHKKMTVGNKHFQQKSIDDTNPEDQSFDVLLGLKNLLYSEDIQPVLDGKKSLLKNDVLIITSTASLKENAGC